MTDAITDTAIYNDFSIKEKSPDETKSNELGQRAFLELMITQLENQNPLDPQENTEFIAQLAQFSSVESLDRLNNNFDSFTDNFVANQALQASTLVGRSVTVPSDKALLEAGGVVAGSVDIPSSTGEVILNIYDESGALVEEIDIGPRASGEMVLRWDGRALEVDGELLSWQSGREGGQPPGQYTWNVHASIDGEKTQLNTALSANVNSVTVGANGALTLNLSGVGAVSLEDVKQFNE